METEIQINQITELLPACVSLCYVDYREDLSHSIDRLQECISENSWDRLYEMLDDYVCHSQGDGLEAYKEELKNSIIRKFDLDKDEAYALVYETYQEEIEEILYQRDDSDAVMDLLKNTGSFSLFIDTGFEIEEGSWGWSRSEQTLWLKKIKHRLKIESGAWDDAIRLMLSQANYGGQLVIYFYDTVKNLITDNDKDWKSVMFSNPVIAIINTGCGSGDHTRLTGHRFRVGFNRKNLFIDRYFKYNYVSAVCGMSQNWCKGSVTEFSFDSTQERKSASSPLAAQARQDRKYALIYSQGKCTFGDMDINRHRDTFYINDFPCGNKCPHCGTFWID